MNNTVAFQRAMDALQQLAAPTPPWHDILAMARDFIGADAGTFLMFGPDQDLWMLEQTGIDAAAEREYREHFHALDPLVKPTFEAAPGTWFDSLQLPPPHAHNRGQGLAFHADYFGKHRIGQVLALVVENDQFVKAGFSFQRSTAQPGARTGMAQQALARYTRALEAAFRQRRQAVHARLDTIEATLAGLGEATFLATRRGLVWRLSPLAAEWLHGAHMLCPRHGTLTHANPLVARRLRLALEQVAHMDRGATLAVPAGWGEALRLDIGPAHASIRLGTENTLFARLRRNSAFAQPDAEELCAHFGLTPAEGRVLAALVSGHAPNEYASAAGLAQHTVRNQIAALMRKMGCSRQAELVRLGALLR